MSNFIQIYNWFIKYMVNTTFEEILLALKLLIIHR